MLGCRSRLIARASRRNRGTNCGSDAQVRLHDLERLLAPADHVLGEIDLTHSAPPELGENAPAIVQDRPDHAEPKFYTCPASHVERRLLHSPRGLVA
jgi:hypothetical protein